MKNIFLILLIGGMTHLSAQPSLKLTIINAKTNLPVAGAIVQMPQLHYKAITDSNGIIIINKIKKGKYELECEAVSFLDKKQTIDVIAEGSNNIMIALDLFSEELAGVMVVSTRSHRSFNNTPTRTEIIAADEIHEEAEMQPGDIRNLLSESTGVQTQQTSATSGNASIRLQGLDGRYTQILRDGFPLYTGAANGLGILQTPPLDLRQVEIIKGSASTLYGGGAIAGIINLISRVPTDRKELNFHLNSTSAGGLDLNGFFSQKFKKTGVTVFVSRNTNRAYDPANISFSAIPEFERYTLNPKLFIYVNNKTQLNFGINTTFENRLGGDMRYINHGGDSVHSYFEQNKTKRVSTQLNFDHRINNTGTINIKNSISFYNRDILSPAYHFNGSQVSSFSEASYSIKNTKTDWVAGINLLTDHFSEKQFGTLPLRNYEQNTTGLFVQNTWNASKLLIIETGLRLDHINAYGSVLLPRIATLFKVSPRLTSRVSFGLGYKPPGFFTEETEAMQYRNVLPIDTKTNKLETSYGINADINYRMSIGQINLSINQLLFYTVINNPLTLSPNTNGTYNLLNLPGKMYTKGAETNLKFSYSELAWYLGYTLTDTRIPLTPKHRLNSALVYEIEGKWRFGTELYYFSKQLRSDGSIGKNYWLGGFLAEKIWKHLSVYLNFENIGDVRQTKFESIYTGTVTNPVFKDIYAPLDGFVMNGGIRWKIL